MAVFRELQGVNVKFLFSNPEKAHPCAEPRRLTYYAWKSVQGPGLLEEPGQKKKLSKHLWCAISRIRGKETPWGIVTKFCTWVDIRDVITCATFGDDRLRVLGVAGGRISHFPHWLASSPLQHSRTVWLTEISQVPASVLYECKA